MNTALIGYYYAALAAVHGGLCPIYLERYDSPYHPSIAIAPAIEKLVSGRLVKPGAV